jgi:hypothetical protein
VSSKSRLGLDIDKITEADLDSLVEMVRKPRRDRRPSENYRIDVVRWRLRETLRGAQSLWRAAGQKQSQSDRNAELATLAETADKMLVAYEALHPVARWALSKALLDRTDQIDARPLHGQIVEPLLTVDALTKLVRDAARAAQSPAPKGRPAKLDDYRLVETLAGFVDWYHREVDNSIAVAGGADGPFHRFVLKAYQLATGRDVSDGEAPLLRAIRDVARDHKSVALRLTAPVLTGSVLRVNAQEAVRLSSEERDPRGVRS